MLEVAKFVQQELPAYRLIWINADSAYYYSPASRRRKYLEGIRKGALTVPLAERKDLFYAIRVPRDFADVRNNILATDDLLIQDLFKQSVAIRTLPCPAQGGDGDGDGREDAAVASTDALIPEPGPVAVQSFSGPGGSVRGWERAAVRRAMAEMGWAVPPPIWGESRHLPCDAAESWTALHTSREGDLAAFCLSQIYSLTNSQFTAYVYIFSI